MCNGKYLLTEAMTIIVKSYRQTAERCCVYAVCIIVDLDSSLTQANFFGRTNARQLRNYTSAQS